MFSNFLEQAVLQALYLVRQIFLAVSYHPQECSVPVPHLGLSV